MMFRRFFFYGPFKLSSSATAACGIHYNGTDKDGNNKWDKIVSVFVWRVETATSPMELLSAWNYQVHVWLKYYIQARLVKPGQKAGAKESMTTFIVSAFWHGVYPGYWLCFTTGAIINEVNKDVYRMWIFFQGIPRPLRLLACHIGSHMAMNYAGGMLSALTWP